MPVMCVPQDKSTIMDIGDHSCKWSKYGSPTISAFAYLKWPRKGGSLTLYEMKSYIFFPNNCFKTSGLT